MAGCSYPKAVRTYEFVVSYDRMTDSFDPDLSLVYVPADTALGRYRGVVVGDFTVGGTQVESPELAEHYTTYLRVALACELLKMEQFEFVTLDTDPAFLPGQSLRDVLLVEGMITKFDMGSGALRYFSRFLFLGLGATDLQIEGRMVEADTGRLVVEFVDRRRHLANTPWGPNPRNFRKGFAMNVTARETAHCLAGFMEAGFDELAAVCAQTLLAENTPGPTGAGDF